MPVECASAAVALRDASPTHPLAAHDDALPPSPPSEPEPPHDTDASPPSPHASAAAPPPPPARARAPAVARLWEQYAEALGGRIELAADPRRRGALRLRGGRLRCALQHAEHAEVLSLEAAALQAAVRESRATLRGARARSEAFWTQARRLEAEGRLRFEELVLARQERRRAAEREAGQALSACHAALRLALGAARRAHEARCVAQRERREETQSDVAWRIFCARVEHEQPALAVTPLPADQLHALQPALHHPPVGGAAGRRAPRRAAAIAAARAGERGGQPPPAVSRQPSLDGGGAAVSARSTRAWGSLTCTEACATREELDGLLLRLCAGAASREPASEREGRGGEARPLFPINMSLCARLVGWFTPNERPQHEACIYYIHEEFFGSTTLDLLDAAAEAQALASSSSPTPLEYPSFHSGSSPRCASLSRHTRAHSDSAIARTCPSPLQEAGSLEGTRGSAELPPARCAALLTHLQPLRAPWRHRPYVRPRSAKIHRFRADGGFRQLATRQTLLASPAAQGTVCACVPPDGAGAAGADGLELHFREATLEQLLAVEWVYTSLDAGVGAPLESRTHLAFPPSHLIHTLYATVALPNASSEDEVAAGDSIRLRPLSPYEVDDLVKTYAHRSLPSSRPPSATLALAAHIPETVHGQSARRAIGHALVHKYCGLVPPSSSGTHFLVQLEENRPARESSGRGGDRSYIEKPGVRATERSQDCETGADMASADLPQLVQMLQDGSLETSLLACLQRPFPEDHGLVEPCAAERNLERMLAEMTAELEAEAACTARLRGELEELQLGGPIHVERLAGKRSPSKKSRRTSNEPINTSHERHEAGPLSF
ncbi:hypothetical protein AB1Y20_009698 [Prymnesium parvum]|uniref:Uncharacterized protein n=1 Tax=Prymnesium parvum TaxID=97485 RepID=A0AB34K138_PRYPA